MSTLPYSITYSFDTDPSSDPVLETLAAPYFYNTYQTIEYLVAPALGVAAIGLLDGDGRLRPPKIETIYPLLALQHSPFTLIGDVEIAVAVDRGARPSPSLHPLAAMMNIYKKWGERPVAFTAVAATMARASRRGIDLVFSITATELLLYGMGSGDRATLEAVLQAYLYKLTRLGTRLRLGAASTPRYARLLDLAGLAARMLRDVQRDVWETLQGITRRRPFIESIVGGRIEPPVGDIDDVAESLPSLLSEAASNLNVEGNIVYVADGRTSLVDLYFLSRIRGAEAIHLLLPPEAMPAAIYLSYRLAAKVKDGTLRVNVGGQELKARIYLVSSSDYWLTRRIIDSIPNHMLLNRMVYKI